MPNDNTKTPDAQALLKAIADAYAQLAADPEALAEMRTERAVWDATLADGLPTPT